MPRKEAIDKLESKVLTMLAKRDTHGDVRCSVKGCATPDAGLKVHHRYIPVFKKGDQYKRLGFCLENPDNCEIDCKWHVDRFDKELLQLWDMAMRGTLEVLKQDRETDEDCIKRVVKERKKELEFRLTHPELYDYPEVTEPFDEEKGE